MNNAFDQYEVWFVTGAQLLYGGDAVIAVDAHSNEMVNGLNESGKLPVKVVYKGTANSSKEVETVFNVRAADRRGKIVASGRKPGNAAFKSSPGRDSGWTDL